MEKLISKEWKKLPLNKRPKYSFFFNINKIKNPSKLYRINSNKRAKSLLGMPPKHVVSVCELSYNFSTKNNIYNLSTYCKSSGNLDEEVTEIHRRNRSLDFYYFYFLGYYNLNNTKYNYLKFLKEYLHFYFEYIKQTINFIDSYRYKKLLKNPTDGGAILVYKNNDKRIHNYSIKIPSLLKCPDIGKMVVTGSHYLFFETWVSNIKSNSIEFVRFNKTIIKEAFNQKNFSYFYDSEDLNGASLIGSNLDKTFDFANGYDRSKEILSENIESGYVEKYDDNCDDIYYELFNEKYSLKDLFDIAFRDLIKDKYSF